MSLKIKPEDIFPPEILEAMPRLGETSNLKFDEVKVPLKVFNCSGAQTWWLYEYDPEERIFFGYVCLDDPTFAEFGTVSMDELLEANRTMPFLKFNLDRDKHWNPDTTVREVVDKVEALI